MLILPFEVNKLHLRALCTVAYLPSWFRNSICVVLEKFTDYTRNAYIGTYVDFGHGYMVFGQNQILRIIYVKYLVTLSS